jgi:adenylate cyclase
LDAEALMALRLSEIVEKTRYTVPVGRHTWEIDVFSGRNKGLIIAEIELKGVGEDFQRPHWLGGEVTGQSQYYNGSLARLPFCQWRSSHLTASSG